jgi:hypothetical protein
MIMPKVLVRNKHIKWIYLKITTTPTRKILTWRENEEEREAEGSGYLEVARAMCASCLARAHPFIFPSAVASPSHSRRSADSRELGEKAILRKYGL